MRKAQPAETGRWGQCLARHHRKGPGTRRAGSAANMVPGCHPAAQHPGTLVPSTLASGTVASSSPAAPWHTDIQHCSTPAPSTPAHWHPAPRHPGTVASSTPAPCHPGIQHSGTLASSTPAPWHPGTLARWHPASRCAPPPAGPELSPETGWEISIQKRWSTRMKEEGRQEQAVSLAAHGQWRSGPRLQGKPQPKPSRKRISRRQGRASRLAATLLLVRSILLAMSLAWRRCSGSSDIAALRESGIRLGRGFPTLTHAAEPLARLELAVTSEPRGRGLVLSPPSLPFLQEHPGSLCRRHAAPSPRAPPQFAGVTSKSV